MKPLLAAAVAISACSTAVNAAVIRFEIESIVAYSMTSGAVWSFADGGTLLLQLEVDDSMTGDWLKWRAFVDDQLLTVPLPDTSASMASQVQSRAYRTRGAMAHPDYVWLHSEHDLAGWQFGHMPDGRYWESASYYGFRGFALDLYSLSGLSITDDGFSGLKSDMPLDLYAEGWIELSTFADSCHPAHLVYGCSTTAIEPAGASFSFYGGRFRLGWSTLAADVPANNAAPLLIVALWALMRRRKAA